jgi:S1-C subfamily serine protease
MTHPRALAWGLSLGALLLVAPARGDESAMKVAAEVNEKLVKIYGAGGIQRLASYGTGVIVSPDGYILTVNSHILESQDLRVHLADGTRYHAKVVAREMNLDVALIRIGTDKLKVEGLAYYDVAEAARRAPAEPGTNVLAFSNQFQIATRDEPMSVQRGVIAAYTRLHGRTGISEAPYTGNLYVVDAPTNNPGAGGGVITTRKGELLGIIGKDLRNETTNTWVNYALPISAAAEVTGDKGEKVRVSIVDMVDKKEAYRSPTNQAGKASDKPLPYTGLVLVPNVVDRTPPYIDRVEPDSPAALAKLKPDDLIVYVDGQPVSSIQNYNELLKTFEPGREIRLDVRRGDTIESMKIKLSPPRK